MSVCKTERYVMHPLQYGKCPGPVLVLCCCFIIGTLLKENIVWGSLINMQEVKLYDWSKKYWATNKAKWKALAGLKGKWWYPLAVVNTSNPCHFAEPSFSKDVIQFPSLIFLSHLFFPSSNQKYALGWEESIDKQANEFLQKNNFASAIT